MAKTYLFPEILSITLYRYSSLDTRLYTLIIDNCKLRKHKNTILVRKRDVEIILKSHFKKEIEKIPLISDAILHKEANTIYFLNKIINEMPNLRWFQISYENNVRYTRVIESELTGEKILNFVFKVVRGSFRTFDFFKEDEMEFVNYVLKEIGCIKDLHYNLVKLKSLITRLENLQDSNNDDNIRNVCARMLGEFQDWTSDDPEALIITDYLEDI